MADLLLLQLPSHTAFTITPCPVPEDDDGTLTFVSSMYVLPSGQSLTAQLPESLYRHLLMSFASQAQQFRGYMFNWNTLQAKEVSWLATCHAGLCGCCCELNMPPADTTCCGHHAACLH